MQQSINTLMNRRRYNIQDNDLIWESFQNRSNHKQQEKVSRLMENDIEYIEQFLIDEGLMDTVKSAVGGVKNFAQDKILKPLMDMLVNAMKKDPATADKLADIQQAAQSGDANAIAGAMKQAGADTSVMDQFTEGEATQAESLALKFKMNRMICEALVESDIISESKSILIQEKHYAGTINSIYNESNRPTECPWMPNIINEKGPTAAPAQSVNNKLIASQIRDLVQKSTGGKNKQRVWQHLMGADKTFANFVQKQGAGAQPGATPPTGAQPGATPPTGAQPGATPPAGKQPGAQPGTQPSAAPATAGGGSTGPATQPGGGSDPSKGILGKVWNFVKSNKGAIGGLAAMGIAAALIATGGPLAVPATRYLTGAMLGGVRGAIKGATGTQGGFVDKLKGAANQAGADSMKGGAIGTVAGAAGDAVGSVMGSAADTAAAGEVPSAAAEPYTEPAPEPMDQASDYGGNPEDYSAGGVYDQETPEIGGTSGGFDPDTGESNMDMSDEEAAAFNASQPMSDDEFRNLPSQGGMAFDAETGQELPTDANGEVPGVDYQEPTATSAADAEAGVGTIDPVTGKEIEAIDPENKPGFMQKMKSLLPGGTKPREVFGNYTGKG